jgi:lactate racemase
MATASKTTVTLKYGNSAELRLDFPPDVLIAACAGPAEASENAAAGAARAFQSPLDFPPLRHATVPGDHVVLALAPGVQDASEVIAALVPVLMEGGAVAEDITILRTHEDVDAGADDPRSRLPAPLRDSVQLQTHEPSDRNELSYLAADAQGEPIYMNRQLCDADLIIPIGSLRPGQVERHRSAAEPWNETLYPTFADRKTIDHLAPNGVHLSSGQKLHRQKQVDQAAWLLGVQITAQVVPGRSQRALTVLAGSPEAVFHAGRARYQSAWETKVPQRANLVIAGIGGGRAQQTWANVGVALEAALGLVNDDGAIVLCTELDAKIGPALRQLIDSGDFETAGHRLRKQHSSDAPLARLLAEAQDRVTIYLLSRLPEDEVTPLGIAHVGSPEEVARLASHHESCIVVADAQYARPVVDTD